MIILISLQPISDHGALNFENFLFLITDLDIDGAHFFFVDFVANGHHVRPD